ncbi:4-hydroxythreonine-4-phosphate dehydrogenase PdxA [Vibrio sp. S4M6]|uniref:4-hydroxythreonine-4-phosphate dehydrogenase PdxA n=1 Tax=Vibrio sinus TaxID=2946865 RepID=UPI00202AA8E9|nr:4-hydroxythreonine-4-phosphate dehydrogenase PdxA [Vibrio sinus]MCL9780559.1 4-hydroxythreonine-4-phosphate dehydrogenase PdxA [Vibrio sinus]
MTVKRIMVTAGEPAGIGPDLVLALSKQDWPHQITVCADKQLLAERAKLLQIQVELIDYQPDLEPKPQRAGSLIIDHIPLAENTVPGTLNEQNSTYVLQTLERAANACMQGEFDAIVTGPVHKGIINQAGVAFSGHTEFFAEKSDTPLVVMMLATQGLRVALATTHIPLAEVSSAVTRDRLTSIVQILHKDMQEKFAIDKPCIYICGLNPHAGENGYLGHEEIDTITPAIDAMRDKYGYELVGPLPADTIFSQQYLEKADVILGMYHDQVLPVLKYKGFGRSVNITLGLPFIRTSVDHGTALDLAGKGIADSGSFITALEQAVELVNNQVN